MLKYLKIFTTNAMNQLNGPILNTCVIQINFKILHVMYACIKFQLTFFFLSFLLTFILFLMFFSLISFLFSPTFLCIFLWIFLSSPLCLVIKFMLMVKSTELQLCKVTQGFLLLFVFACKVKKFQLKLDKNSQSHVCCTKICFCFYVQSFFRQKSKP